MCLIWLRKSQAASVAGEEPLRWRVIRHEVRGMGPDFAAIVTIWAFTLSETGSPRKALRRGVLLSN